MGLNGFLTLLARTRAVIVGVPGEAVLAIATTVSGGTVEAAESRGVITSDGVRLHDWGRTLAGAVNPFRFSRVGRPRRPRMAEATRYYAQIKSGHGHLLEASSLIDAAITFAEAHAPMAEDDAVQVIVQAEDGGPQHCFVIHLDSGAVEACG